LNPDPVAHQASLPILEEVDKSGSKSVKKKVKKEECQEESSVNKQTNNLYGAKINK